MDLTFIGHNGFVLQTEASTIYVDPLLSDKPPIGHLALLPYPAREIDRAALPRPDAVILTHEHADHFNFDSLGMLGRHTPVYVGELMPAFVVQILERQGHEVRPIRVDQPLHIGDVSVEIFYPTDVAFWESRVSQLLVRSPLCPCGIFLAVDAPVSRNYVRQVDTKMLPAPLVVALSNNTQVSTPSQPGALENCQADFVAERDGLVALRIFRDLLRNGAKSFSNETHFMIVGGGFVKEGDTPSPAPYGSQHDLLSAIGPLLDRSRVIGPLPGARYRLTEVVTALASAPFIRVPPRGTSETPAPIRTPHVSGLKRARLKPECDQAAMLAVIHEWLDESLPTLLMSPFGQELLQHAYGLNGVRRRRCPFLVGLELDDGHTLFLACDVMRGCFQSVEPSLSERQMSPFGLIVPLVDLHAVLRSRAQVWDLAGISLKQWFPGGQMLSPMAALYDLLGEILRPDLALPTYAPTIGAS